MNKNILIVEDETELATLVKLHLTDAGYRVTLAADGHRGLELALGDGFDLIVLDLMLPDLDGLELCRRIRRQSDYIPIFMLTARSGESDRVLGLEVGADDCLTKPFSVRELVARVRAILRRIEAFKSREDKAGLRIGDLEINLDKRRATVADRSLELTHKELDLLVQLARHPGRVYSRSELLDLVWGYGHDAYEHTVSSHVNRLRNKLEENPGEPRYLLTVWGVGYKLFDPNEAS